jgi:carboxymethylenebutenolidase
MLALMPGAVIDVPTPDGTADAYLARPSSAEPRAGVLFVMDAFGLRPRIEEMADRIAERGYAVLAPNFFYRSGRAPLTAMPDLTDPDERSRFFESLKPFIRELTPERIDSDGRAYLDWLEHEAPGPVAIIGYCMGARIGWRIATAYPDRVRALAGFHAGRLVTDEPDSPHMAAGQLRARVYFGHADNDQSMTPENVEVLERTLTEAGVPHRTEVYDGAAHGYTMSDTAAYNEAACERHFSELFALLEDVF